MQGEYHLEISEEPGFAEACLPDWLGNLRNVVSGRGGEGYSRAPSPDLSLLGTNLRVGTKLAERCDSGWIFGDSRRRLSVAFQFFHSKADGFPMLRIPALGLDLGVRLGPEASGKALTILETVNARGFGPPLHRHRETEVFRVLEGCYLYEVNGRRFEAGAGDIVSVPGGDAHAFINITDKPARQLVMMLPGMDAQRFFVGLGEMLANGRPSQDTLNAFGKPWGVEFLGPPLSASVSQAGGKPNRAEKGLRV
jgi:quercetin dioxygenase-like cupin family protein